MTRYRTIVADPPWRYQKANEMGIRTAEAHYDTLTTEEIAALPISDLAASDAHLYLWLTNAVLLRQREGITGHLDAAAIARAWGFEPMALLTWVKTGAPGMGWYFRGHTEHVLFGVKGRLPVPAESRLPNIFEAPRGRHSTKPDAFLDLVEQVSPGPYLEMFARRARFGWDYYGDESLGTAEMPEAAA